MIKTHLVILAMRDGVCSGSDPLFSPEQYLIDFTGCTLEEALEALQLARADGYDVIKLGGGRNGYPSVLNEKALAFIAAL